MEPTRVSQRRRGWIGRILGILALLAFLGLGSWSVTLVRRTREVQQSFDRAGGQAVQMTELLDGLNKLHQSGANILQSYAVGYQRLVFDKQFDLYLARRLAPKIPWDPSCMDCLDSLDGAVRAHQAQALKGFELGARWEALPPGEAKERVRRAVSDELFLLEQREGAVLKAFQDLESANRKLLAEALLNHQRNAAHVILFAGVTLFIALGLMIVALIAWKLTQRSRMAERLTRTLMDVVPDGLLVWDEGGRIIKVNPAASTLLNQPEASLIGQPITRWLPPEASKCLVDPALAHNVSFTLGVERGRSIPLEASAGCLRTREGVVHVGVFRDITRRLETELRMREAQKMEAIGALAAGVVHDVRNLLAPISLAEEILSEEPGLSPAEQRLLGQIHRSAEAANALLSQLLRIARKEAPTPKGSVDLHACIEESLALIRLSLGKGIQVDTTLEAGRTSVSGSRTEVVQVFSNLFINAAHAMNGQGLLTVRSTSDGSNLEIRVGDSGGGMAPEVLSRIFEPLFTTKGKDGTGLGLFNVKQILEGMGGSIHVESTPGAGTIFTLRIPAEYKVGEHQLRAANGTVQGTSSNTN